MSDFKNTDLDSIEKELSKSNPTLFKGIPDSKRRELIKNVTLTAKQTISHHEGPIPSPDMIEKYNTIIPNGADRIMCMAENQQAHRIKIENLAITEQLSPSKRGQIFGFVIGIVALMGAVSCILMGHEWGGGALGVGGITGLVSVFVIGKNKQTKSLESKSAK